MHTIGLRPSTSLRACVMHSQQPSTWHGHAHFSPFRHGPRLAGYALKAILRVERPAHLNAFVVVVRLLHCALGEGAPNWRVVGSGRAQFGVATEEWAKDLRW